MRLRDLPGLGPKTEQQLEAVGISTPNELRKVGPTQAFLRIRERLTSKPSLNLLYALIGAVENRHWLDIAQNERESILMSLEGIEELERLLAE